MAYRGARSRGGSRRMTDWVGGLARTSFQTLGAATSVLDQSLTASTEPETIIRVRGNITVQSDQQAVSEDAFGAIGFGIVSLEALTIGATAIPAPYTNLTWDGWFCHQFFACPVNFASAVGFQNISRTFDVESKAMRKLDPDERMVVMVENGNGADGLQYLLSFRLLIKAS